VIVIGFLLIERKRLIAELDKKDSKIDKIIDDYYNGNLTIAEAFNSLTKVLFEIKGKIH
jgi:SMC interacting uncharacterized protein involved in chromosome segregation